MQIALLKRLLVPQLTFQSVSTPPHLQDSLRADSCTELWDAYIKEIKKVHGQTSIFKSSDRSTRVIRLAGHIRLSKEQSS